MGSTAPHTRMSTISQEEVTEEGTKTNARALEIDERMFLQKMRVSEITFVLRPGMSDVWLTMSTGKESRCLQGITGETSTESLVRHLSENVCSFCGKEDQSHVMKGISFGISEDPPGG